MRPFTGEGIPCEIGFVGPSTDDLAARVLMAFDVSFFDINAPTMFAREGTRPEDCTEVIKRRIAIVHIRNFENLLGWSCCAVKIRLHEHTIFIMGYTYL
jgi:hypothetical protein